ncbi:MAG: hypothetical protein ACM3JF_03440 [Sphaerimonospora mesophila]
MINPNNGQLGGNRRISRLAVAGLAASTALILASCASPGSATSNNSTPVASAPATNETPTPTASEAQTPPPVEAVNLNTPRIEIKKDLVPDFIEKLQTSIDANIPQTLTLAGESDTYSSGTLTIQNNKQFTITGKIGDLTTFTATTTRGDKPIRNGKDRDGEPITRATQVLTMKSSKGTTVTVVSSGLDLFGGSFDSWNQGIDNLKQVVASVKAWKPGGPNELGVEKQPDPPVLLNTRNFMHFEPTQQATSEFPTHVLVSSIDPNGGTHYNTVGFKLSRENNDNNKVLANLSPKEVAAFAEQHKVAAPLENQATYPESVGELFAFLRVNLQDIA